MSIWRHVDALVLHIFGVELMPMTLTQHKELMSSTVLGAALISNFREILSCWHREDDESFQRQSAKRQNGVTDKNGSKGKAISKGYHRHKQNNQKVSKDRNFSVASARCSKGKVISNAYFKGSNGKGFSRAPKGKSFEGIGKTRSTADDARQTTIGLQVVDASFPGELAQALAILEKMKDGRGFWKRGGQRREIRVLLHCYGGMNRTCGAYCALIMALASMTMESAIASWIQPEPSTLHSKIVSISLKHCWNCKRSCTPTDGDH